MELGFNLLLDHSLLHVIVIDVSELKEVVVLKSFPSHVSSVSWVVNASLSVDHAIERSNKLLSLGISCFKILIKDVSSLQIVGIVNQNFSSASWAEHSAIRAMNQTIELINLCSIFIPLKILVKPVISSSLDILPVNINLSSCSWVILSAICGMDHAIDLADLKNFSLLSPLLLIVESLEQLIISFLVI